MILHYCPLQIVTFLKLLFSETNEIFTKQKQYTEIAKEKIKMQVEKLHQVGL